MKIQHEDDNVFAHFTVRVDNANTETTNKAMCKG